MERLLKRVDIECSIEDWEAARWCYEIISFERDTVFQANLWLFDEYEGYLVRWKVYRTSPKFSSEKEAEAYAVKTWVK